MREEVFSRDAIVERLKADFVPVAITVPRFRGDDEESKLYQSFTTEKPPPTWPKPPVPQGVCVTNCEGRVLEWIQVSNGEKGFLDFLERNRTACAKDPNTPGEAAVPREHRQEAGCPALPHAVRGSLVGTVYGRALGDDGTLAPDVGSQRKYMQEKVSLRPHQVEMLEKVIAESHEDRVRLPNHIVKALLREAHLGQKDCALLRNPLGIPADVRELDLWATRGKQGGYRVVGETQILCERRQRLHHEMKMNWTGFIDMDPHGVRSLILLGQGTYDLQWPGFSRNEEAFGRLFEGRAIDERSKVRFGIVLERCVGGTESNVSGIEEKMELLQEDAEVWKDQGKDLMPIGRMLQRLEPLMKEGKRKEAEELLDKAIKLLEEK